jgi:hypothetical protein
MPHSITSSAAACKSLNQPGGNVTGVTQFYGALGGKRLKYPIAGIAGCCASTANGRHLVRPRERSQDDRSGQAVREPRAATLRRPQAAR